MNLLAAIIIFWNTMKLGEVVASQKRDGKLLPPDLLAHVSPFGWKHINLTGEYRRPKGGVRQVDVISAVAPSRHDQAAMGVI